MQAVLIVYLLLEEQFLAIAEEKGVTSTQYLAENSYALVMISFLGHFVASFGYVVKQIDHFCWYLLLSVDEFYLLHQLFHLFAKIFEAVGAPVAQLAAVDDHFSELKEFNHVLIIINYLGNVDRVLI